MTEDEHEPLPGPSPEALLALRLIPKFGDALAQYAIDRHQRRLGRAGEVVTTAAEALELDPATLIERIIEDDRLADLLNDAIQAAARSGLEAKRRALGKVLAQAVAGDDAEVDEAIMLTASLAHLEPVHVRLMARLVRRWRPGGPLHTLETARNHLPYVTSLDGNVAEAAILQLQAWGLVTSRVDMERVLGRSGGPLPWDSEPKFKLTNHGLRVVEFLEVVDHEEAEE